MGNPNLHLGRSLALALVALMLGGAYLQLASQDARSSAVAPSTDAPIGQAEVAAPAQLAGTPDGTRAGAAVLPVERPATTTAPAAPAAAPVAAAERRGGVACATPHRVVRVPQDAILHAGPNGARAGRLPARSAYLGQPMNAWVQQVTRDGRWGKVTMPWSKPVGRSGWVRMAGLRATSTKIMLVADLSERTLRAYRGCSELFMVRTAIGRPGSPSPQGRYWVTDRVAVPAAQRASFGTYAFGLSTVQPNLPAGWTGGDQMAIHGTGAPGSIGQAASAGCLRVSELALDRLKPLLRSGTPVVIQA